jgi:hypothetical protein
MVSKIKNQKIVEVRKLIAWYLYQHFVVVIGLVALQWMVENGDFSQYIIYVHKKNL